MQNQTPVLSADELQRILTPAPLALAVYEQIASYFRKALRFRRQDATERCSVIQFPSRSLPYITIKAHADAPAIAHETLHVKMMMDGFPIRDPESDTIEFSSRCLQCFFNRLGNAMSHAVFFDEFLRMGFDGQNFIADGNALIDAHAQWASAQPMNNDRDGKKYGRGFWNVEYLEQWRAREMRMPSSAEDVIAIGCKHFPGFEQDVRWIVDWFNRGDFRRPTGFAPSVNEFLNKFGCESVVFMTVKAAGDHVDFL